MRCPLLLLALAPLAVLLIASCAAPRPQSDEITIRLTAPEAPPFPAARTDGGVGAADGRPLGVRRSP